MPELALIMPQQCIDERGVFMETFHRANYRKHGVTMDFVQDNLSSSVAGVLRGLHYRIGAPEGKLVQVVQGKIYDVAVDIRRSSRTFGRWFGVILSAENRWQLWIPPGFAHGFYAMTKADVMYKVTGHHAPDEDRAIRWDDADLKIEWPIIGQPILSAKDAAAPRFSDSELLP